MASSRCESKDVELSVPTDRSRRDRTTVRCLEAGEGPPVVLLHGIGLDAATISWKHTIPALAGQYHVVAPDLPGHGESDKARGRYTTSYYLRVVEALIDELDLQRPRIAGISMGGAVALGYALDYPVEQLVLVDSFGLGRDTPWRPGAALGLRIPGVGPALWRTMGASRRAAEQYLDEYVVRTPDSLVADVYDAMQDPANGRTLRSWQRSEFRACGFRTCYLTRLRSLSTQTLLVHGAEDTLVPPTWSRRADDRLPDSDLALFEACGHWPPRERPDRFNDALRDFLVEGS
jgi:pimeloyl-ACP methyl ester carboxylesterase